MPGDSSPQGRGLLSLVVGPITTAFLLGIVLLEVYCACIHPWAGLQQTLPFLPLMLISSYCAAGLCVSFMIMHWPVMGVHFPSHAKSS